jgi:hypothetical protein
VLKQTRLNRDWTACRTGDDRGREALLLMETTLAPMWEIVACPYVALAIEPGEIGLLMRDLTPDLLPDRREPLSEPQERALLGALTRLHARFWRTRVDGIDWLVRPRQYCDLLALQVAADPSVLARCRHRCRPTWCRAAGRPLFPVCRRPWRGISHVRVWSGRVSGPICRGRSGTVT